MTWADAATVGVLILVAFRLSSALRRLATSTDARDTTLTIVRGIRWRHLWPVPLVLAGVLGAATLLVQIPGLSWGWWTGWFGGTGNPVTGGTTLTVGTTWEWLIPLVFLTVLMPLLPLFAFAEERMFRQGAQRWANRRRAWMVVKFGLVHALIGIPIGVAMALSLGGAYFMSVYLRTWRRLSSERQATLESTRAHTAYNGLLLGTVLVALVVGLV